jgi:Arylsulfotransferase (ASST)
MSPRLPRLVVAAGALAALALPAQAPAKTPPAPTISPADGTPDASPRTGISVLGPRPSDISSVTVKGSTSGSHAGRLLPFSRKRGAVFQPDEPLTEGERADVVVRVKGRKAQKLSFTVARLVTNPPFIQVTATQPDKLQSFVSEPVMKPPKITVLKRGGSPDPVFLTPLPSPIVHPGSTTTITLTPVGLGGPLIVDRAGNVVWFKQEQRPNVAANLQIQRFDGKPVLTWWRGPVTVAAYGLGEGIIADTRYRTKYTVRAGNGYAMDIHEFSLTPEGDAMFPVYSLVKVHVPGTPKGTLTTMIDSILQQVDVRTGRVTWEWHSLAKIPVSDSYATQENSAFFDVYHINSIEPVGEDRVLVSMRDTSTIYLIDRPSGRIVWKLGGKSSDFKLGRGARFWFQHDARMVGPNRVSLFDDEAGPPQVAPTARALFLSLDMRKKRASVEAQYTRSNDTSPQSEGSVQVLDDENVFAGFGAEPFFTEWTKSGKKVYDARLPIDDGSYRVYTYPWRTTPKTRPAIAARSGADGAVAVYASWNGATEVARWQVLAGAGAGSLRPAGSSKGRTGFETRIDLPSSSAALYAVQALDAKGKVLSTSRPVAVAG